MIESLRARILGGSVPAEVPEGVQVRRSRWIPVLAGRLSGMGRPARAVTLGNTIVVHPEAELTARLVRHELAHVRQWRASPALFPVRYAWRHLVHGYYRNPYEIEARAAEAERDPSSDGEPRRA